MPNEHARDRQAAEALFAAADCPPRHVANLDQIDPDGCRGWTLARDAFTQRTQLGDGFTSAIVGPGGTGKTQMLTSAAHRACGSGLSARYVTAAVLVGRMIRASEEDDATWETGCRAELLTDSSADLLLIDDAHQLDGTSYTRPLFEWVLNRRYAAGQSTLFASTETAADFVDRVGPFTAGRIVETGRIVPASWPSFRPTLFTIQRTPPVTKPATPAGVSSGRSTAAQAAALHPQLLLPFATETEAQR